LGADDDERTHFAPALEIFTTLGQPREIAWVRDAMRAAGAPDDPIG